MNKYKLIAGTHRDEDGRVYTIGDEISMTSDAAKRFGLDRLEMVETVELSDEDRAALDMLQSVTEQPTRKRGRPPKNAE